MSSTVTPHILISLRAFSGLTPIYYAACCWQASHQVGQNLQWCDGLRTNPTVFHSSSSQVVCAGITTQSKVEVGMVEGAGLAPMH